MAKITVSYLRELLRQYDNEEISISRFVELINKPEMWAAGEVECELCGHSWVAVRPADVENLECPNCENFVTIE